MQLLHQLFFSIKYSLSLFIMNVQGNFLKYWNFWNTKKRVIGITIIMKGFTDKLHSHNSSEYYYLLWGSGKLYIDNVIKTINAPYKYFIPIHEKHKLIPTSNFLILLYYFPKGPFNKIKYIFHN